MSFFWVTWRSEWINEERRASSYVGPCIHIPCKIDAPRHKQEVRGLDSSTEHMHQTDASTHFLAVANGQSWYVDVEEAMKRTLLVP